MNKLILSNLKIRDLLAAHNQLDGYNKIVEQNGQESAVRVPYTWGVKTSWNITNNIKVLRKHVEEANKARDELLKVLSGGTNEIDGEKEPEKLREFQKGVGEIEEIEVEVYGLLVLKAADILNGDLSETEDKDKKPDKRIPNPIPGTALASLAPVLDLFRQEVKE
jgi:hypothetical protein